MKAIVTRYLPCTNTKPTRIVATAYGNRLVCSMPQADIEPHKAAAIALCQKMDWSGELVEGGLPNGDRVFVFVNNRERIKV